MLTYKKEMNQVNMQYERERERETEECVQQMMGERDRQINLRYWDDSSE